MCICICMCIYACMHVYAYIYMYMYIFVLSLANHFREKVEVFPFSSIITVLLVTFTLLEVKAEIIRKSTGEMKKIIRADLS